MGCSFSCNNSPKSNNIRIVGLNGSVQDINYPITVAEVTGKPGKHFLFTQPQLLAAAATPLKLDAPLMPGGVYFLLPTTLFHSTVSPQELVPIAKKLSSIAQTTPSKSKLKPTKISQNKPSSQQNDDRVGEFNGMSKSGKSRSWKPILSTIRERSFNRRSESDLQAEASNIDIKE